MIVLRTIIQKNGNPIMLVNMVKSYIEEELKKFISVLEIANNIHD